MLHRLNFCLFVAGIELVNLLNDKEKKHTGKIADYLPGRSSALIKEKQKVRSFLT